MPDFNPPTPTPMLPAPTLPTLPLVMQTAPERIYLDIGEDCPRDTRWDQLDGVTWSEDDAMGGGIAYVRESDALATINTLQAELHEQCRLLGMGSEREARLMAERNEARAELGRMNRDRDWLRRFATIVANWQLPITGKYWDDDLTRPVSYEAEYGSLGVQRNMQNLAACTLMSIDAPRTPSAGADAVQGHGEAK